MDKYYVSYPKVSKGRAVFSFSKEKISQYDFEDVREGVATLNSDLPNNSQIPLTNTTILLFQRVVAWARINSEKLEKYDDSTKDDLSRLFRDIGKVPVRVEPQLVIDELVDRKLLRIKEEKIEYDLHHLSGKLPGTVTQKTGWFKSILYVLVIVLFWGSMIGQIFPQTSVGGVGNTKAKAKGKGKAN